MDARARILEAAVKRIAREGIDGVRIARIAMDAGVSAALVHYHFDSRDALLVEALEYSYELAGNARAAPAQDLPREERLEAVLDACLPYPHERDDFLLWVELWLRASRQPELSAVAARLYARMHEWVSEVVVQFDVKDADRATGHLLALLDGYGVRALFGDLTVEEARAGVLTAMAPHLSST